MTGVLDQAGEKEMARRHCIFVTDRVCSGGLPWAVCTRCKITQCEEEPPLQNILYDSEDRSGCKKGKSQEATTPFGVSKVLTVNWWLLN
jgi:hypothetical protein